MSFKLSTTLKYLNAVNKVHKKQEEHY